ncbi:LamG domain-containing protein [Catellatospora sp. KI3]|uniref:LamG-like jellyroll fold domain-containing protein n=1 Tax=Catellatospora sp. KI3 TaxID=3041620 RepID=UPI0024831EB9|nr:LamG-like jellyroll fold domain-containing protein [Catellatospora sp. KI3]MDI1464214.1 LamG domain-containing protein [Catellatospora sp. KI3]
MRQIKWWQVVLVLVLVGAGGALAFVLIRFGDEPQATPVPTGAPSRSTGPVASPQPSTGTGTGLRLDFDGGLDRSGAGLTLTKKAQQGGELTFVAHDAGLAVRFPESCHEAAEDSCPRAILEVADSTGFNPGLRPLHWGAALLMAPGETSKGANVVQKGYSMQGTQFKLQVDGYEGKPSCVISGPVEGQNRIFVAVAAKGVADGGWHRVECARAGAKLTVLVDGVASGEAELPADLAIDNEAPVRIGGKGAATNNDQFHGMIDDVFIDIR